MDGAPSCDGSVAGILLTGGTSRRMGFDKASMLVDGIPCAARVAAVMLRVVTDAVEVGPGVSGLPVISEEPRGGGPLVALCAGMSALEAIGPARSTLVLACDLPFVTVAVLRTLAGWPGKSSVVPVVGGRPQPLCARWSASDLAAARRLVGAGARSMRALLGCPGLELVDEVIWPGNLDRRAFSDVDTVADLDRLGLGLPDAPPPAGHLPGPGLDGGSSLR